MKPAKIELQPNETLEQVFWTTRVVWMLAWVSGGLLTMAGFVLMARLLREGVIGTVALGLLLGVGFWMFGRAWYRFSRTQLLLTSERLIAIRQLGWFDRTLREVPFHAIASVSSRKKGFYQTIFRYGKLRVEVKGDGGRLVFDDLPHPEHIQEILSRFLS